MWITPRAGTIKGSHNAPQHAYALAPEHRNAAVVCHPLVYTCEHLCVSRDMRGGWEDADNWCVCKAYETKSDLHRLRHTWSRAQVKAWEIVSLPPSLACKRIERCSPSRVDYFYGRSTCVHRQPTGLTCNSSMYHLPVKSRVWQINTKRNWWNDRLTVMYRYLPSLAYYVWSMKLLGWAAHNAFSRGSRLQGGARAMFLARASAERKSSDIPGWSVGPSDL